MSIAIEIADVSKRFRMYREKPSSLKQRILSGRVRAEDFWALRDVSFDVAEGEFFALIGQNGSGKSTLLKVIAGILRPSEGVVRQRGRIAGLLELGAGFHPELTGRENVYLNAAFLGLSHRKTDAVYDDIVEFAELREFMDTAVKFYSSGMLVRLGFACAVHVDRVRTFQKEGRTIVLVTHALDMARQLCDRAAMLDHGVIHAIGGPDQVVREMRRTISKHDLEFAREEGSREIEILGGSLHRGADPLAGALAPGECVTLQVDLKANEPVDDPVVSFALHDGANNFVFGSDTAQHGLALGRVDGKRRVRFQLGPVPFTGGQYWVTVGVHSRDNQRVYHVQDQRYSFEVRQTEGRRDQTYVPVTAEVEDL